MRRRREDTPLCVELPLECLLQVARIDWLSSGPLARTCKHNLRALTHPEALRELVDWVKQTRARPPLWLHLSLPYELICSGPMTKRIQSILPQLRAMVSKRPAVTGKDVCLTGGYVARQLYGHEWYCDIDLFASFDDEDPRRVAVFDPANNLEWDLVRMWMMPPDRVIEGFDHSLVQQGYCTVDDRFYLTPLALYTYEWGEVLLMPTATSLYYNMWLQCSKELTQSCRSPWGAINKHALTCTHRLSQFHDCPRCPADKHQRRWCERIRKYVARFPDFKFTYVCIGEK